MTFNSTPGFDPEEHPRNDDGRFGFKEQSEPEVEITAPASHLISKEDAEASINMSFPTPQANSLGVVLEAAEEVRRGVRNGEDMSDALGVHRSEGGFYAAAAGLLGLVDRDDSDGLYVTEMGERVLNMESPRDRERAVLELANAYPGVRAMREEGYDGAAEFLRGETDLSDTTVERRTETLRAWAEAVAEGGIAPMSGEFGGSRQGRAPRRRPVETTASCSECFMLIPSGYSTCPEHPDAPVYS